MRRRIGLIGCGRWGKNILRDLKTLDCYVEVVARQETAIANARKFGADNIVKSLEGLSLNLDGYIVATPTVTHVSVIKELLPQSRPIFVEKPISDNMDEVLSLPKSAEDLVFVMHKWRYHPAIEEMKKIAQSEEFGPVTGLRTRRVQRGNPHQDTDAIWILAPHDISIAAHIFDTIPMAINAIGDPFRPISSGVIGELVDLRTGAQIVIEVSDGYSCNNREVALACRDAIVYLSGERYDEITIMPWAKSFNDDRIIETRQVPKTMPLLAEIDAFLKFLEGGPAPFTALAQEIEFIKTISQLRSLAKVQNR
jgi:predicted dehydrogenase